jgi:hypothetical protein
MQQFESEIRDQAAAARGALQQARDADDDYLAGIHQAELDALLRTAANHGVVLDLTALEQPVDAGSQRSLEEQLPNV